MFSVPTLEVSSCNSKYLGGIP